MKILFEREGESSIFALAKDEIWRKKVHDELLFAEIKIKAPNLYCVAWEDSYPKEENFGDEDMAKAHILRNFDRHKPYSNGTNYEIEEE